MKYYMYFTATMECEGDLIFNECGSPCERTCDEQNPICIQMCEAKCECPRGTVRLNPEDREGEPRCGRPDECGKLGTFPFKLSVSRTSTRAKKVNSPVFSKNYVKGPTGLNFFEHVFYRYAFRACRVLIRLFQK